MNSQPQYNLESTIFLIEDNATDIMMIREAFSQCGIVNPVTIARDGAMAMDILKTAAPLPGLIILDLNLPKIDGHGVLEQIKKDAELRKIPIVVLTSSKSPQDIERAYQLHANCYITKPMDFYRFMDVIGVMKEFWLGMATLPETSS